MAFRDVVGQEELKARLCREAREGRIPHALMFHGPEGSGKLALAVSLAQYLLCRQPGDTDGCGTCNSCRMAAKLEHPDLHFSFPVIRQKDAAGSVSDAFVKAWRSRLLSNPYFTYQTWLDDMGAENQQALIYTAESDALQRKLSLKSSQGGCKVVVMWCPEKMNAECANKLLKLIEEPPARTYFLMVSREPDMVLPTILSRTQRIYVRPLKADAIARTLVERCGQTDEEAARLARVAHGDYTLALQSLTVNKDAALFFDLFVILMRLSYQRKIKEMKKWADQVAALGRERQKAFLDYCQHLVRENFMYNFRCAELNCQNKEESDFSVRFARFINERNVIKIMNELSEAQRDVEQNVSPKMIFFDLALKMIVLLIQ
ncbi:MAG: DNA polymerase III subunit delta' [Clostridium sp.]|nr:DNA polymerase III subunit delta' [Clostridium sp.]